MHLTCIKKTMGQNASQLEKEIGADQIPINEHFFGLVNFGNTCYCNSVIQALYFCKPFREKVLNYKHQLKKSGSTKENLLTCLADLFHNIATQKKRVGTIAPKKFVGRLKKENELFDNYMQQDAHEFLNYLLNTIADILLDEKRGGAKGAAGGTNRSPSPNSLKKFGGKSSFSANTVSPANAAIDHASSRISGGVASDNKRGGVTITKRSLVGDKRGGPFDPMNIDDGKRGGCKVSEAARPLDPAQLASGQGFPSSYLTGRSQQQPTYLLPPDTGTGPEFPSSSSGTWVHDIFQGTLTNETRCLNCESVSSKDEDFLDLSVDVEQNTSITHCLKVFSNTETLCTDQKYYCDCCCSKQEAQKRMRIKKLPSILALHLKRFKFLDQYNRYAKLSYRVLFPLELRLFNTSDDAVNPDRLYDLVAVVVHCGSTPNRGHYITVVKSHGFWLLFDDDIVDKIDPANMEDFFGLPSSDNANASTASFSAKNSESAYILFYQAADV